MGKKKKYEILFYLDYDRDKETIIKTVKYINDIEEFKKNFKYTICFIKEIK